MTVTIALTGKSGSGKTTLTKTLLTVLKEIHPKKSVLLFDNDLSRGLANAFGMKVTSTIHRIKTNKHKYSSDVPEDLSKQEYIEWALEDIVHNLYDDVDLIVSGYNCTKETLPYMHDLMDKALQKLFKGYDFVIFDCEYDLRYLAQIVDMPMDVTLIVSEPNISSIYSGAKIHETSKKMAALGQIGIILNKIKEYKVPEIIAATLEEYDIDLIGRIPYDSNLVDDIVVKENEAVKAALKEVMYRLNLPLG